MPTILSIRFCLLFFIFFKTYSSVAQLPDDTKATLNLHHLVVNKNGQMLAFQNDRIFKTDSFGGDWVLKSEGFSEVKEQYGSQRISDYSLFNTDTFLLSGYMLDSSKGNSFILRTTNGGRDFQKIYFLNTSKNQYIDEAFCNNQGQAWLSQASLGMFFSADFGLTWQQVGKLPRERLRASSIFFKDTKTGIIATGQWGLYLTNDNCKTFESIPTPYDQKQKPKSKEPFSIDKAFLFHDWIVVYCDDKWFYTKSEIINWQPLEKVWNVFLDAEMQQLWVIDTDFHLILLDKELNKAWQSPVIYKNPSFRLTAQNGDLYFFNSESLYKVNQIASYNALNYHKEIPIQVALENRSKATYVTWGWDNSNLYQSTNLGKTWYRVQQLTGAYFGQRKFNALNDSVILMSDFHEMERFEYNSQTKQAKPYTLTHLFDDFLTPKIKKIRLTEGSSGCFHHRSQLIDYEWNEKNKRYESAYIKVQEGRDKKNDRTYRHYLSQETLDKFMQQLNEMPEKQLSWKDFKMTKEDVDRFLKEAKQLKDKKRKRDFDDTPYNDMDNTFLNAIANRTSFDDTFLKDVFCQDTRNYSTTTTWVSLIIENELGETITLTSDNCYKSPYYITWVVKYKNWEFRTADIGIFKFMSPLSPKEFWEETTNENWGVYLDIAKYLYRKKLGMN